MNTKKDIKELVKLLNNYSDSYYNKNISLIEDKEYDLLLRKLEKLEEQYPEFKLKNSPTSKVGYKTLDFLEKGKHNHKMLSLQNALNFDELDKFFERIQKDLKDTNLEKLQFTIEPKIDGVSISLIYEKGILIEAITRGDGFVGEIVTQNVLQINSIPKKINYQKKLTVRGEIFSTLSNFKRVNELAIKPFSNPRNFASGTIRLLNPQIVKERNLSAYFYQVVFDKEDNKKLKTQNDVLKLLKELGFPIYQDTILAKRNKIKEALIEYTFVRDKIDFEIDGVVIKINDFSKYEILGETTKFPKWAIAYKFPPEIAITKLLDIFPTIGRTGLVSYNAKLEKVNLLNTNVSSATLHNLEYIKKLDLRIGDFVEIKKSGEIIPKVIKVVKAKRSPGLKKWKEEINCPVCKEELIFSKTKNDQYCINENCASRKINVLIHFVSKKAMEIDGLGEKILHTLYENNIIKNIDDIYFLTKEKLQNLEGFQERRISKLLSAIEQSKKKSLENVLFGLGIPNIGYKTALDLSKEYKTIDLIMDKTVEELIELEDFGEVKANSIVDFFAKEENKKLITNLKNEQLNFEYIEDNFLSKQKKESKLYKKIVVITGTFSDFNRQNAEKRLNEIGAIVRKSISSKTDFLICGEKPSQNKIKKIAENKILKTIKLEDML